MLPCAYEVVLGIYDKVNVNGLSLGGMNSGGSFFQVGVLNRGNSRTQLGLLNFDDGWRFSLPFLSIHF
jgi:hypothetical protein